MAGAHVFCSRSQVWSATSTAVSCERLRHGHGPLRDGPVEPRAVGLGADGRGVDDERRAALGERRRADRDGAEVALHARDDRVGGRRGGVRVVQPAREDRGRTSR